MSRYRIHFLGVPKITVDGREIKITRRKSMALLAIIACTEMKQGRNRIIGLLWPDQDESHARGSLRTALSTLNSELGEILAETVGDFVSLDESVEIDAREFAELAAKAEKNDFFDARTVRDLEKAAESYRGDFLDGFSIGKGTVEFEDWQFNQEEYYRKMFSKVLERLVQSHTLASSFDAATNFARRWVDHEPDNEHAHRRLIELYAWAGKRKEALHQFDLCKAYLDRELGVEPEEATLRLYESVRENRLKVPESAGNDPIPTDPVADSSVFYSTVLSVGLTNSAEKLMEQRPYDTASIVNILFHRTIEEALKRQSVDAWLFTGDTLVALFGVPNTTDDDAYRAVISALEILQIAGNYGFRMTAGIASGLVYSRSDENAGRNASLIGPAVTQASLLRFFGDPGMIFTEDATRDRTKDAVAYEKIERGFPGMGRTQGVYRLRTGDSAAARIV